MCKQLRQFLIYPNNEPAKSVPLLVCFLCPYKTQQDAINLHDCLAYQWPKVLYTLITPCKPHLLLTSARNEAIKDPANHVITFLRILWGSGQCIVLELFSVSGAADQSLGRSKTVGGNRAWRVWHVRWGRLMGDNWTSVVSLVYIRYKPK